MDTSSYYKESSSPVREEQKAGDLQDDSLEIHQEIELLIEIQDILDELEILKMV